ncbi:MAG: (2Fe-2S) ferredoxin domain-containing protein [Holophagaceae bacterium]|uniref:(2Fe-2S) ferredoxin domain-containing protein n=1 Tax=Candidatus Geothrix skivensis TaxID=2954439 RepID=A0A9D7SJW9_9BACT|nr:(2Fe-2S) ferredoxin domain-containing protein [Candidatus Geothrix skivensis]
MDEARSLPSPEQDASLSPIMEHGLQRQVLVCTAKSCAANGSEAVLEAFRTRLMAESMLFHKGDRTGDIQCITCGSVGFCAIGPAVLVYPDGVWYAHVTPEDVPEIIDSHLKGGVPVERLVRKRLV